MLLGLDLLISTLWPYLTGKPHRPTLKRRRHGRPLEMDQLDRKLLVWGYKHPDCDNALVVSASPSYVDARIDRGLHRGVLVFYHPDHGWTEYHGGSA